jgi:hypothetical protein
VYLAQQVFEEEICHAGSSQSERAQGTCARIEPHRDDLEKSCELAECRSNAVEDGCADLLSRCDPLHDVCDNNDMQDLSIKYLSSNDAPLDIQSCSIDEDSLEAQVESNLGEVHSLLIGRPEIHHAEVLAAAPDPGCTGISETAPVDESREQFVTLPSVSEVDVGQLQNEVPQRTMCFEECVASCQNVALDSGLSFDSDMGDSMCTEKPFLALMIYPSAGDTSPHCHYFGEEHSLDTCSDFVPYSLNTLNEEHSLLQIDASTTADGTFYDLQDRVVSLLDPGFEDWQADVSQWQVMQEDVTSLLDPTFEDWRGDVSSGQLMQDVQCFGADAFYSWGSYLGQDCSEEVGFSTQACQEFEMKTADQPSFQAISWVADDEQDTSLPEIVLGERENEYHNLQLIAEMGDWCVLKELVAEKGARPFYWNRSTGQRTWKMPQIMEETGLGDALMSYAKRAPAPNHDSAFHRRQVRAVRLSHGFREKAETLRSRRRTCHPGQSSARMSLLSEQNEGSDKVVPEFLLTDDAFPTLKNSFESLSLCERLRSKDLQ